MSPNADRIEARQRKLDRLEELELSAVEAAHASYLRAIDTPDEVDKSRAYQRMARSMRQSLALSERFDRLAAEDARRARQDAEREAVLNPPRKPQAPKRLFPADIPAANARAREIRAGLQRLIWSEGFEHSDYDGEKELEGYFYRSLEDFLAEDRLKDDFTTRDLDEQVASLARAFGLNPDNIARWRDLPDPDPEIISDLLADRSDDPDEPKWRSSG